MSRFRSGTCAQPGSSSNGSDATTTAAAGVVSPFVWRYQSVSPQAVAAIECPSVSRKLNRPVPSAASTAVIVWASAAPIGQPARSRSRTSAHRNAESTIASSDSRAAAPMPVPPAAGARSAIAAAAPGQPSSRPLWLNSQGPWPKGAAAASPSAVPAVAERTAARTAPDRVTRAMSGSDGSPQMGTDRRYRAEAGEDLPPDRVVPVPERGPAGHRGHAERAAPQHLVLGPEEDR